MLGKKKKEDRVIYINHSGELLIWLFVILLFVSFSSVSFIHKETNDDNDYSVFLQDVDGLIVGSPVRMMGVEVGYVTKIKPTKDEVYVKFILTNPDTYIPQGTKVTVEFSGMAGSKSLELYMPDKNTYVDDTSPLMTVNPPKRLHDAMWLLNDMYKKISSIINTSSSFGKKLDSGLGDDNKVQMDINVPEFLHYSDKFVDESAEKEKEIKKNIWGLKKNAK